MKQKLIVVGSGMVGVKLIEQILLESPDQFDIRVFNKESIGGYNRIMLSPVLAGEKTIPDIITHDFNWFKERSIRLHSSTSIVSINQETQEVVTDLGATYQYDKLVIATGSSPFILPLEGADLPGVVSFRDTRDVNYMIETAKTKKKAVVIGGGLLGLEAANGLMKLGMDVTVVHLCDVLMNVQMDELSGGLLRQSLEANGMKFKMPAQTQKIIGEECVEAVEFSDGSQVEADLVVMAVGIRPNIELGKQIGLDINRGILVDDQLKTSVENIYALGECVEHNGELYGLVAPLYEQAAVLAKELSGTSSAYKGSFVSTKLKVTGISLFSAGNFHDSEDTESLVFKDLAKNIYRKVVLKDGQIQGAVMFGDVSGANWIFDQLVEQNDVSTYRDTIIFGEGFSPSNSQVLN